MPNTRYEDGPPGYPYPHRADEDDGYGRRARVAVHHARDAMSHLPLGRRVGALSVGGTAFGAFAVGAVAFGAMAIGALAISRLAIGRMGMREGYVQSLTIDELRVRRLRIDRQDGPQAVPRWAAAARRV